MLCIITVSPLSSSPVCVFGAVRRLLSSVFVLVVCDDEGVTTELGLDETELDGFRPNHLFQILLIGDICLFVLRGIFCLTYGIIAQTR